MDLQSVEQEKILSIVNEAAKWTKEETEANLQNCLPVLNKFLSCSKDFQIGLQIIRFVFGSFLPHLSLASSSEKLLNPYLPSLEKYFYHLLEDPLKENVGKTQENLECLIVSVECCGILLKYLLHQHQEGSLLVLDLISNIPCSLTSIIKSSVEHYLQKDQLYQQNLRNIEDLLQTLLKETLDGCLLLCEMLNKIEWPRGEEHGMGVLAEVCENLSKVAHYLSRASELKGSIYAWKTYTSLVQNYSEELKRRILLIPTVQFLKQEICEGLMMLHSFESIPNDKMPENEEKVFLRVLKKCSFNLKIVIVISEKYGGFLRGAHADLLSIILLLMSYSPHGLFLENLSYGLREKIDEQLSIGICPLLSNLGPDKDFIQEVIDWLKNEEEKVSTELKDTSPDFPAYLLLLVALMKLSLSDPLDTSLGASLDSFALQHLFQILPHCHAEFSRPQMLPGVMHDGRAQEKVSLYAYTLMYTCGFVSVWDEDKFSKAEPLLFKNALGGDYWKSLFASDILCFIARYGSASLCESHCSLLMKMLKANPTLDLNSRKSSISLLARLLALVKPQVMRKLLCEWISDGPEKEFVAELVYHSTSSLDEYTQRVTDEYILSNWKDDREMLLHSERPQTVQTLFQDLDAAGLYLKSSAIQVESLESSLVSSMVTSLVKILQRFPSKYIECSLVSRLFCIFLEVVSPLIQKMTTDDICMVLVVSEDVISSCPPSVLLSICHFTSSLGKKQLSPNKYSQVVLQKLSRLFTRLISHPNEFVHLNAIKALVSFAQVSKYEEVFANCISQLDVEVSQEVTQYLEGIGTETEHFKIIDYLRFQLRTFRQVSTPKHSLSVKIPVDFERNEDVYDNQCTQSIKEKLSKRRKLNTSEVCPIKKTEFLLKLDEIRDSVINADIMNMENSEKLEMKNKLEGLVSVWASLC